MDNKINNIDNKDMRDEDLKSKVLEFIEKEKIKPTSRLYFSIKDKAFWSLLLISVLACSVAFSVMIFSFINSEVEFYQITNDSLLDFILNIIPFIWVLVFAIFAIVGYENLKHTDTGYKYSITTIIVTGLIVNALFGVVFHYVGVSKALDQDLSFADSFIRSSASIKRQSWDQPERGVISGDVVSFSSTTSTFVLKDFNGNLWMVSSSYVPDISLDLISTSSEVRVIGVKQNVYFPINVSSSSSVTDASTTPYMGSIIACYILPWDSDDYISGISKIKGYLVNATSASERNDSEQRNKNCRAIKSYNIIRSMVELK